MVKNSLVQIRYFPSILGQINESGSLLPSLSLFARIESFRDYHAKPGKGSSTKVPFEIIKSKVCNIYGTKKVIVRYNMGAMLEPLGPLTCCNAQVSVNMYLLDRHLVLLGLEYG